MTGTETKLPAGADAPQAEQGKKAEERSWIEEIEVSGEKLVAEVKRLAAESRVRRIRVIEPDGDVAVDVALPVGAIAGGAVVLAAPVLAVIGALAALVAKVKIEIVREEVEAELKPGD